MILRRIARVAVLSIVCVAALCNASLLLAQPASADADPVAQAIAAELDAWTTAGEPTIHGARIALPERVQEFYTRRGFRAAWDNARNAEQLRRMDESMAKNEALEDALDEALDESFPASDPPSMTEPNR